MDDNTYNDEPSSASDSFERRLRLANAAVGIAILGAKLSIDAKRRTRGRSEEPGHSSDKENSRS